VAQVDKVTLTGTSGTASILSPGGSPFTFEFYGSLSATAMEFESNYAELYLGEGIILTSHQGVLTFTASTAGSPFNPAEISNQEEALVYANGSILVDSIYRYYP
jgi:hypothetical protein